MKLSVTQNKIEIIEKSVVNQGEHYATGCYFDFTKTFDGLVKKAVFTNKTSGKSYEMPILNDACVIPSAILTDKGTCTIGVYAFSVQDDGKMVMRYSPTPVTTTIESGSYKTDIENPCDLTASQAEQYEATISQKVGEMNALMDSVNQRLSEGDLKGEKGDPGENGQDGINGTDGRDGVDGANGQSAYEIAVANGFTGTPEEWLASLKGVKGDPGTDGRDGVDGTNGADGVNGTDGRDGTNGKSAYELAVAGGYTGTQAEWLASLKGEKGEAGTDGTNGTDGADGANGTDGADGKSAYEVAVANGYTGIETEWLASLKGADGVDGTNGTNGIDGQNGADGFSPEVNLEQVNDTTAKLTVTKKDGSTQSVQFGGLWKESETEVY